MSQEQNTRAGGDANTKGIDDEPSGDKVGGDPQTKGDREESSERAGGDANTKGID